MTHDARTLTPRSRDETITNVATNTRQWLCVQSNVLLPTNDRAACGTDVSADFNQPTWNLSLNYQINPDLLVYLAHRRGYRSGGINPRPTGVTGVVPFDPELVSDLEAGFKSDFDIAGRPARFNVATYYAKKENIQRSTTIIRNTASGPAFTAVLINAAKAHTVGGEAEFIFEPTDRLDLQLGYAYTKSVYDKWNDIANVAGVPVTIDVSDSEFAFVPRHQLNASVAWRLPLPAQWGEFSARISAYNQSGFQTQDNNTANCGPNNVYRNCFNRLGRLPGYTLTNLRLDCRGVARGHFDLAFFVNNVTDEFYKTQSLTALGSIGTRSSDIGAPRMWGVEVRVPFGDHK
jgi:iron complex outermembrane receptor protein